MNSFTFALTSYNFESYILEHLESIKYQIVNYGTDVENYIIIIDDYSKDYTPKLIDNWLDNNSYLFKEIVFIKSKINVGGVKSYLKAISQIKTEKFSFLAGDDYYLYRNIYRLMKGEDLLLTIPVYFFDYKFRFSKSIFNYIFFSKLKLSIANKLSKGNFIEAPGAFRSFKIINNEDLKTFLDNFYYMEDIATWIFLFFIDKQKLNLRFSTKSYVAYRKNTVTNKIEPSQEVVSRWESDISLKNRIVISIIYSPLKLSIILIIGLIVFLKHLSDKQRYYKYYNFLVNESSKYFDMKG